MKTQNERDLIELTLKLQDLYEEHNQINGEVRDNELMDEIQEVEYGIQEAAARIKAEREKHKADALDNAKAFNRSFTTSEGIAL